MRSTSPPRVERVLRWLMFKSDGNDGPPPLTRLCRLDCAEAGAAAYLAEHA
jgi:hypothetical protein